ncbi:conserved hypothetical protein [Flavobacterium sp. 9AF]|uniref:OB-fold protein n=1 Tax=Flavobacterium sp. 9AF TaxID=2653142 RepID=UPI0012F3D92C|nr:hypothetical protein [Flavobacterium sp. 9AF]VXB02015.1 conserved hypothetical protein [Flavobacterium sp. 9AF]
MKKNKWIFILIILIVVGVLGYNYIYKSHRDISSEEASYSIKVATLAQDFKADENAANTKYLDKTIDVNGKVTSYDATANLLVVDEVLSATLLEKPNQPIEKDQEITIKGRFIGYDELLEEFKMDQVSVIK